MPGQGDDSKPCGVPPAEVSIDEELVRDLLRDQHPDLADLALRSADSGWDNEMVRLGDDLAVRLPRRALSAPLIEHEQRSLPTLAPRLPLPIPAPVRTGVPGRGYPWRWSVVPWLPGESVETSRLPRSEAPKLGAFLRELHGPAPPDAPRNPYRGGPLADRAVSTEERLARLASETALDHGSILGVWDEALSAPLAAQPTWLHGDLHPRNVLHTDGAISAIIDWSDITEGDPATDLASVWMLFDDHRARTDALAAYGEPDDATYARARGWAVAFGAMLLVAGLQGSPENKALGVVILRRAIAG